MDMNRLYNCVRVLVALQCLELVWSYSILIDTLKNDQQIETSLNALIQSQVNQERYRRQASNPQTDAMDTGTQGEGQHGSADGSHGDAPAPGPESSIDSGEPQSSGSDPKPDSSGDPVDSFHGNKPSSDPSSLEGQDPSSSADSPSDPGHVDSGSSESGHSDGGSMDGVASSDQPSDQSSNLQENMESTPANLRSNWQYAPPPGSFPMTSVYRGDAPMALPMTAHQGKGYNVPEQDLGHSVTEQGHGDSGASDHSSMETHSMDSHSSTHNMDAHSSDTGGEGHTVDTVPLESHEGQPMALPQQQQEPWFSHQRQPMAMPQKQGNQRPPPNWGNKNQGPGPQARGGGGRLGPGMQMGGPGMPMGGPGMGPGASPMNRMAKMNMMQAQSELMQDHVEGQQDMYKNMYNPYARFDPRYYQQFYQGGHGNLPKGPYGAYPFPPYRHGDHGDFEGFPGYKLDIHAGFPPCTNMSDPACRQRMMAQREIQIETPYGEMDMEPGEMDLEGAAAHQLLKQIGIGGPNMNPHMQEINLNKNVLNALKQRFGVNTTAGIRGMSSNPEFQAFMYRVLTHSAPVAPGEYNANLTQAEVNWIMNDLGASSSNHRLTSGNLDHAKLNTSSTGQQSVMTINGGQNMANPWGSLGPGMGMFPFASKQVQDPSAAVNKPGIVQALVQGMLGGESGGEPAEGTAGGEGREAEEKKKTNGTSGTQGEAGEAQATNINGTQTARTEKEGTKTNGTKGKIALSAGLIASDINQSTNSMQPDQGTGPNVQGSGSNTQGTGNIQGTGSNPATLTETTITGNSQQTLTQPTGKEADIIGKDGKFGLSKDQRTRNQNSLTNQAGTPVDPTVSRDNLYPAQNNIPIGIKEAGLETGAVTNTTLEPPVEALPAYPSSTAFAIAAISMIILAIIIGPILCYLCKLKEKREEKQRKQKAMKNREVSENNIMESMVLHDFGSEAPNSVGNEGASPYGERYTGLDSDIAEIERYKKTGYLP